MDAVSNLFILLLVFICFISYSGASIITTTRDEQYKDLEIHCVEGEDCSVRCNQDRSCQHSDIYCPSNHSCSISCTSATTDDQYSCLFAHIHCPSSAQCDVLCSGQAYDSRACHAIDIEWPTTYPFNTTYSLTCNGGNACSSVTIQAPGDYLDFTFECPGFYDCDSSFVICPTYAKCNILCSGWYACQDMTIIWPQEYSNANLTCGSQFSCGRVNFPIPPINKDLSLTFVEGAVYGSFINCPKYANCSITCVNASSCAGMIINWPLEGMGELWCGDRTQTCQQVNFPVPLDTQDLTLECHDYQCISSTIFCPKYANCHVICNEVYSCWKATIFWPMSDNDHSFNSTLTCNDTANWACRETTKPPITVSDDNSDLFLNCSGDNACYGSIIHCPTKAECHISCSNAFACTRVTIVWPDNHPYSLQCNGGESSCMEITYKPYDDNADLDIVCSGSYSCKQSTFFCPHNASCNILCDGSSACERSVIHCPSIENDYCNITCVSSSCYRMRMYGFGVVTHIGYSFREVTLPIPPPNTDLSIHCEGSSSYCVDSVIYCPKNASCNIVCEDATCAETTIIWPTQMNALNKSSLICRANSYPYDPLDCREIGLNPPSFNIYHNGSSQNMWLVCNVYECAGAIIHCPPYAECNIECVGNYSCNGAIFEWVDDQAHSLLCGGYLGSCKGVTFTPNNDIDFVLNCTAKEQCRNTIINCPQNSECNIYCSEYDACNNAVINGPNNHNLYVQCDGYQSCYKSAIYAQNVSYFELNGCHDLGSCSSISIWFPPNLDNEPRAIINGAMDGEILDGDFYAIYGWKDVKFVNYDVGKYAVPMGINRYNSIRLTMYCLSDYSKFCRVGYHSLSCSLYGDVTCDMDMNGTALYNVSYLFGDREDEVWYPTNEPTNIPTYDPTTIPTTYPTVIPTVNPTIMQPTSTYITTVVIGGTEGTLVPTKGSKVDGKLLLNAMGSYFFTMTLMLFI